MNTDGSNKVQIENGDQDRTNYEWSPDSSLIAYTQATPNGYKVLTANADGSGTSRLLTDASEIQLNSWQTLP
jgi:Tol biopolymer transport system component